MASILVTLNSLDPNIRELIVGFVGALIFAASVAAARLIVKQLAKGGASVARLYAEIWLQKYLAHHAIFGAKDLPEPLRLFFLVILTSISWLIRAGMFLVFFYGVKALVSGQWLLFLGHWFALNCLFEGFLWAKDCRNDKIPKAIYEEKLEKEKQKQLSPEVKQP